MKINAPNKLKYSLRIILRIGLCVCFVALLSAASIHQEKQLVDGTQMHVVNSERSDVIQKRNLENWIFKNPDINLSRKRINEIDLKKIEHKAALNPWVANVNVYVDNRNELQIDIAVRKPIARIFAYKGNSFYLDSAHSKMPLILGSNYATPVFTNVIYTQNDSLNKALNKQIVCLAGLIKNDSFWNAQIVQIVVQPDYSFVLIPLLGDNQRILFGDVSRAREKLNNLMAFYKHISPTIGWDNYRILDLRFKGQIIAEPTLGITISKPKKPLN